MTKKVAMVTLGCSKNQVDSEIMTGLLGEHHTVTDNPEEADIIVVNTCTFIEAAKEESIDTILAMSELKTSGSCKTIVAAGCLAQRYGDELLKEIPELDGVLGTGNIIDIENVVEAAHSARTTYINPGAPDFLYNERMPRRRSTPKHYAYVKLAEGCDNYCTYCIIPHVRGHFRSRTEESILAEVRTMAQQGVKEVLLIAQDTTRYGFDLYGEYRLPRLIRLLAKIEGIEWIRLLYCYPDLFSDELIVTMQEEPKVCRYVDLPLQHADNKVLKEMNRRGTIEQAEEVIAKLRTAMPEVTIRTTMITGFPGETEQEFEHMLEFVQRIEFDRLGAFAYSQEENTPAAQRLDQVPEEVRESRRDRLMSRQQNISLRRQQRWVGKTVPVILEQKLPDGRFLGRSQGDAPEIDGQVYVADYPGLEVGDMVDVLIQEADLYDLMGEVVS